MNLWIVMQARSIKSFHLGDCGLLMSSMKFPHLNFMEKYSLLYLCTLQSTLKMVSEETMCLFWLFRMIWSKRQISKESGNQSTVWIIFSIFNWFSGSERLQWIAFCLSFAILKVVFVAIYHSFGILVKVYVKQSKFVTMQLYDTGNKVSIY